MIFTPEFTELLSRQYFRDEIHHSISEATLALARDYSLFDNQLMSLDEYSEICRMLGKYHPTLGITWAMHIQQIAGISVSEKLKHYLKLFADKKSVIASATTESIEGSQFVRAMQELDISKKETLSFERECKIISYYSLADYVFATFNIIDGDERNTRLVLIEKDSLSLLDLNNLEFLGMKSLNNVQGVLSGQAKVENVLSREESKDSFSRMIQYGHVGWSSVWLGMIDQLIDCVLLAQKKRNSTNGYELLGKLKEGQVASQAFIDFAIHNPEDTTVINTLKSFVSSTVNTMATDVCGLFGMDGITESEGQYSIARLCRDAHVSICMFPNNNLYTLVGKQVRIRRG